MYLGRVVESAPTDGALRAAESSLHRGARGRGAAGRCDRRAYVPIRGEIPSPLAPPPGCHFHPRCPPSSAACREAPGAARDRSGTPFRLPPERRRHDDTTPSPASSRRPPTCPSCSTRPTAAPSIPRISAPPSRSPPCGRPRTPSSTSSTRAGPRLGATLIAARFPRSYIDPNRSLLDIDASLLEAPWPGPVDPEPQDRARHRPHLARARHRASRSTRRKLTIEEVKRRIVRLPPALPARGQGRARPRPRPLRRRLAPEPAFDAGGEQRDLRGRARARRAPDFVLGDRDGTTCDAGIHGARARGARAAWATTSR